MKTVVGLNKFTNIYPLKEIRMRAECQNIVTIQITKLEKKGCNSCLKKKIIYMTSFPKQYLAPVV